MMGKLLGLDRFGDLVAADAGRARTNTLRRTIDQRANALEIHVPATIRHIVGVADLMPKLRTLAANFTNSCHF